MSVGIFFAFRNSVEKLCVSWGTFVRWVRSGMGTETTSATYRRTQNPLIAKFFYGITGIQRKCQRTLGTKIANGVSITGARIWLT